MNLLLSLRYAVLLSLWAVAGAQATTGPPTTAEPTLEFIENKGQWDEHVRYAAPLLGGRLFAEADGLTVALLAGGGPAHVGHGAGPESAAADGPVRGHALTLHFEGAGPATLTAETPTAERRHYLVGNDPAHWARDVRGFRQLRYAGLWPGVGARVYESADQHLEYDFELAPGAQPGAIGLRHEGAEGLTLDAAGNLLVRTSVGTLTERAPRAWQTDAAGRPQPVACRYLLAGPVVRFALGPYDHKRPLTIDPVVVFATYSGSTANNWGFTATYDAQGNLYSGGIAFAVGYPTSLGAFQTTFGGLIDIAITKYNTSVSGPAARVWATYVGGNRADFPHSLVVNNQGELLLLGSSGSANYPTTPGALQRTFAGGSFTSQIELADLPNGSDLVITRLNASGSALVGSTYLGGSGNDGLLPYNANTSAYSATQLVHNYGDSFRGDILVDAADNVYIASHTTSLNFPVARGVASTYRGGSSDGVVCKLTPALTALTWGTYLGGSGADAAYSLQLAPGSGDVYVAGGTLSADFPVTAGAYRTTRPGDVDGFVVRIAAAGTSLLRATYVGTADYDQAYFLQLGTDGGVYVLGQTLGTFPRTPGLFSTANGTQFIQKFDPNLGQSLLATAFGSTDPTNQYRVSLSPTAFLVDQCDRVYVCGWGGGANGRRVNQTTPPPYLEANGTTVGLPTTPNAAQLLTDGSDFYLAQFSVGLTGLAYGTYYGGNGLEEHVDGGTSRFDPRGIVYQAVCSCFARTGFPIPAGANTYAVTNNSTNGPDANCNNAAFVLNFQPALANAGLDQGVCATAGPQALVGTPGGGVWTGPGVTGSVATGFTFTPSTALVGVHTLTYTVVSTGLCTSIGTRRITVSVPPVVSFAPLPQAVYCRPTVGTLPLVPLTATPAGGTFSGPGVSGNATTGYFFSPNIAPGSFQLVYTLTVNGCMVQAAQPVTVTMALPVLAGNDLLLCTTAGPQPLVGSPSGGGWTGPGVTGSAATGFVFTPSAALVGVQLLTYTFTGPCAVGASTRRVTVSVPPVVSFAPLPQAVYCRPAVGTLPLVPLTATPAGGTFSGPGVSGNFFSPNIAPGSFQLVYTLNVNGCVVQAAQPVTVMTAMTVLAGNDLLLCTTAGPQALVGSPGGGGWSGPGVTGNTATGFTFTPSAALVGVQLLTYTVTGTGTGQCATASSTRRVTMSVPPVVSFAPLPQAVYCRPAVGTLPLVPLTATPAGGTFSGPGVSGNFFSPNIAPGTYELGYMLTANGCVVRATQSVTVTSLPAPTVAADTVLCPGGSRPVVLRGSPGGGVWTGPGVSGSAAAGFVFTPLPTATAPVSLTYSVARGSCVGTASRRIAVAPVPVGQPAWVPVACPETRLAPLTLRFALANSGPAPFTSLVWEFGDGTASTEDSPTHTYPTPGTYQPRLRLRYNADRCETQTALPLVDVQERRIPNIFTPNGDPLNQTFRLSPDCPPRLQVFSRWGQGVFESAAYHNEWDAHGLPSGVYFYLLTYPDGHRVRGWVEVVR